MHYEVWSGYLTLNYSNGLEKLVDAVVKWAGQMGWNIRMELGSTGLDFLVGAGVKWAGIFGWR
jgi:hypothetical protein